MFPIGDSVRLRGSPIVVWTLIGLNTLAFLYTVSLPRMEHIRFLHEVALVPRRYFEPAWGLEVGLSPYDLTPFLTNIFLHGGLFHIVFNLWTLWVFGRALEDRLGAARFTALYLISGVAASLAHALFNMTSDIPVLGASGAIAGVIAAYAIRFPYAWINVMVPILIFPVFFSIPALFFAAIWFGLQVLQGVSQLLAPAFGSGIAWWAHIGGFLVGWLLIKPLDRLGRSSPAGPPDHPPRT